MTLEGFETNSFWNWSARLEIDSASAGITLHALCNQYGLDEDNASCAIAWLFECYERGIVTKEETDGLELKWGDDTAVAELLRKIAHREGIGDLLAEGGKRASEIVGRDSEKYVIHIKGQDSMEAMRTVKEWALGCVVSTRGGAHTRGANVASLNKEIPAELSQRLWGISKLDGPLSYDNKARLVVYYERLQAILDSLNVCLFTSNWIGLDMPDHEDYARLYSTATGRAVDGSELMNIGERIHNIEKAFNVLHAGFDRRDDYPPSRLMEEPIKSGPHQGERLEKDKWDQMLDEYYEIHGWDKETGLQTREALENLGLGHVADDLAKAGRLPGR
jgi:aldehyde:ferredoxin oxidoreductase